LRGRAKGRKDRRTEKYSHKYKVQQMVQEHNTVMLDEIIGFGNMKVIV
jgi:hypothetical protein